MISTVYQDSIRLTAFRIHDLVGAAKNVSCMVVPVVEFLVPKMRYVSVYLRRLSPDCLRLNIFPFIIRNERIEVHRFNPSVKPRT